ncbi:MAG TPA: YbfB/YjiJ family MFS transporter [Stellaceae bacterium]|nr:YbfB/YjiJ family MFS transporter [Stellaceae bacterium]
MSENAATAPGTTQSAAGTSVLRAALSGLCASLIGVGLARFAYTPLIPALIAAGWFLPADAVYLQAGNLAGYLAGALLARLAARRLSAIGALRANMVLATLAFFACATPLSFLWYLVWRFAAGLSGGMLMVLAAPVVLPHVPAARRGVIGGIIFTGVGLGIAASGTLVPLLLHLGLVATWCGLGALALVLTAIAWSGWPAGSAAVVAARSGRLPLSPALLALCFVYALIAVGQVPHMVFLVDFVARGLGEGLATGARYWVLFGVGAALGPTLAGHVADAIGFRRALRLLLVLSAALVGVLAVASGPLALIPSSLAIGAFVPGSVVVVIGRTRELVANQPDRQQAAWSLATSAFALGQATAAYGYSWLFAGGLGHALLYAIGGAAFVLALAIDLAAAEPGGK